MSKRNNKNNFNHAMLFNKAVAIAYEPNLQYPDLMSSINFGSSEATKDNNPDSKLFKEKLGETLYSIGLDKDNFGKGRWNPLGELVGEGQTVFIKPNWVRDFNPVSEDIDALITHISIIKAIIDYALIALKKRGKIIIADAPVQNCDFSILKKRTEIDKMLSLYRKQYPHIDFQVIDLRKTISRRSKAIPMSKVDSQGDNSGDPLGYSLIDLGQQSLLMSIINHYKKFRVTNYDYRLLLAHHNPKCNEYLLSNSALNADLVINMGKMKTHKKAGLTGALKNLVGLNGHKEYLPHHINGSPEDGGDQYMFPSKIKEVFNKIYDFYWSEGKTKSLFVRSLLEVFLEFFVILSRIFDKDHLLDGGWHGNQTIPMTVIDINNVFYFYKTEQQKVTKEPIRNVLTIIDGIIAGEGDGPLRPCPKKVGIIIAGYNPVLIDYAIAKLMGYKPEALPVINEALHNRKCKLVPKDWDIPNISILLNGNNTALKDLPNLKFDKPDHWSESEMKENHD